MGFGWSRLSRLCSDRGAVGAVVAAMGLAAVAVVGPRGRTRAAKKVTCQVCSELWDGVIGRQGLLISRDSQNLLTRATWDDCHRHPRPHRHHCPRRHRPRRHHPHRRLRRLRRPRRRNSYHRGEAGEAFQ